MTPDPDLEPHLLRAGWIEAAQGWEPLPGGQTNQLWRVGSVVVKRFSDSVGNPVFPNEPAHEAAMLRHLAGTGLAPRFRAMTSVNGAHYLLYDHVPGAAWRSGAGAVGALLQSLHAMSPPAGLRQLAGGSQALLRQVQTLLPDLPGDLALLLAKLRPVGHVPATGERALLHGDAVPGNILCTGQSLCLIDWQCPAWGDPVEDLALFLSPAMQLVYRGAPLSPAEQGDFLAAYANPAVLNRLQAMRPWHHWAMAAYCAWKSARGARDYAQAMQLELAALEQSLQQRDHPAAQNGAQQRP